MELFYLSGYMPMFYVYLFLSKSYVQAKRIQNFTYVYFKLTPSYLNIFAGNYVVKMLILLRICYIM